MKIRFNNRYTTIAVYAFLVLAAVVLFAVALANISLIGGFLSMLGQLLTPFIIGFSIAYLLNPTLNFIERKIFVKRSKNGGNAKLRRALALLATYLFAAGIIGIFVIIVLPQITQSISSLISRVSVYINSADSLLPYIEALVPQIDIGNLSGTIIDYISLYADQIMQTIYSMFSQIVPWMMGVSTRFASGVLNIVIGIIISIYVLMDKERFYAGVKKICYAFLPHRHADWALQLTSDSNSVFGGFITGKILDSLIIGILCFLGMSLLGMPNSMLVSVIVGVTNIIPYFGPFIGAIPSFFIILIDSPIQSLWFLVFVLVLQQFDGNILGPKILGDSTGLSSFWVIFSIMLFGGIYGFIGMLIGVPVFSVIYMLFNRWIDSRLVKRHMPVDIHEYCAPESPILEGKPKQKNKERRMAYTVKPLSAFAAKKLGELTKKQNDNEKKHDDD